MRLIVAVVGRPRNAALAAAILDYETRAARYWPLEVREVREERARSDDSSHVRKREGERLVERIAGSRIVACDERGKRMTSLQFASWLTAERDRSADIALVIGGAFGLADDVRDRSVLSLSLAPWTLSHELARLVLAEQLYRAGTIVRGEPYHK
jgi:23S rRNA (pseudouridine1915-N3)-methyltransferase